MSRPIVPSSPRSLGLPLLFLLVSMGILAPSVAWAEDPVRTTLVDVTKKSRDSKLVKKSIIGALKDNDDASFKSSKKIKKAVKKLKFSSLEEGEDAKGMEKALKRAKLDGVSILRVTKKGKYFTFVTIGPDGTVLKLTEGKLKKKRKLAAKSAKRLVKLHVKELGPAVAEYREENKPEEPEKPKEDPEDKVAKVDDPEDPVDTPTPTNPDPGESESAGMNFIAGGVLVGQRNFELTSSNGSLNHNTPFVGTAVQLGLNIPLLENKAIFGIDGSFNYAPFSTIMGGAMGTDENLSSNFLRGGANLSFMYKVIPALAIGAFGGGEFISILIDANPFYTGHRYINARAGLRAQYNILPNVFVMLEGGALPVITAETSGGSYGESGLTIGADGRAVIGAQLAGAIGLRLYYQLSTMNPVFNDPAFVPDDSLQSSDLLHNGGVMVSFSM